MNTLLKKHAENLKKNKKGFTLVELIIVLVILAILAAVAVPSMLHYVNEARDKTNISDARNAYTAAQFIATDLMSAANRTVGTSKDQILEGSKILIANKGTANAETTWDEAIAPYTDYATSKATITVEVASSKTTPTTDTSGNITTPGTIAGQVTKLVYTTADGKKTITIEPGKEPVVAKV